MDDNDDDDNNNNNNNNIFYLCPELGCRIFLYLKFYFPSPFFPIDPFHFVNCLLSHSS